MSDAPASIAGHRFDLAGHCVIAKINGDVCGIRWAWLMSCTDDACVGLPLAHIGDLNLKEVGEIRDEVRRMGEEYMLAIRASGVGGPGTGEIE